MNDRLFEKLSLMVDGQKNLAKFLGIAPQTVSAWKSRGTPPPTKYIPQIADFIGVSVEWLVNGEDSHRNSLAVSGEISGSGNAFVAANHGSVVIRNGQEHPLSAEAAELIRIYDSLDVRSRHRLLDAAFTLERETQESQRVLKVARGGDAPGFVDMTKDEIDRLKSGKNPDKI